MRRALMIAAMIGAATTAKGQVTYPPISKADLATAVQSASPPACPTPLPDTYGGSPGTQAACMPRSDATRPAVIQATTVMTAPDGTFSGAWPVAFVNAPTGRSATVDVTATTSAPVVCAFFTGGVTASTFTGKCWQIVPTTLPATIAALGGLVLSPIANAASGMIVRVTGRQ